MIEVAALTVSVCSVAIAFTQYSKNSKRQRETEIESNAKEESKIMLKLEFMSNDMKEIKLDSKRANDELQRLSEEMAVVKRDVKSLHHRVDKVEGKEV